jgi:hypothetical protein
MSAFGQDKSPIETTTGTVRCSVEQAVGIQPNRSSPGWYAGKIHEKTVSFILTIVKNSDNTGYAAKFSGATNIYDDSLLRTDGDVFSNRYIHIWKPSGAGLYWLSHRTISTLDSNNAPYNISGYTWRGLCTTIKTGNPHSSKEAVSDRV